MIQLAFCCVWNWDARPFPDVPDRKLGMGRCRQLAGRRLDLTGIGLTLPPPAPSPPPTPGTYQTFPALSTLGWSAHLKPKFSTLVAPHVSGSESGAALTREPIFDIELTYEILRSAAADQELQTIAGFFAGMDGAATPFWVAPPGLSRLAGQAIGTGDGSTTTFPLVATVGGVDGDCVGTSGVIAVYLNGESQGSRLERLERLSAGDHVRDGAGRGVADHGRLWHALAVPVR